MLKKKTKLFLIILIFALFLSFNGIKNTYGIFRKTLSTSLYLNIVVPPTNHTVTFVTDGGTLDMPSTRTVTHGNPVGTLPVVTLSGYTFGGWYTDTNYTTQINAQTVINNDVSYYALLTPDSSGPTKIDNTTWYKDPVTFKMQLGACWTDEETGKRLCGVTVSVINDGDSALTSWSASFDLPVDISLEANNASFANISMTGNRMFFSNASGFWNNIPANGSKSGHIEISMSASTVLSLDNGSLDFTTDSAGTQGGVSNSAAASSKNMLNTNNINKNLSKTSVDPKTFNVTFNPNGGNITFDSKEVQENSIVGELPIPTKSDYVFDNWYTEDGTLVTTETIVDSDVTYNARWVESVLNANITNSNITLIVSGTEVVNITNGASLEYYSFSSNDQSIATVNSSGLITAIGPGITQIKITGDKTNDIKHIIVQVDLTNDIKTFDMMPTAMRNYFNNIDIWTNGQTDGEHVKYDSFMDNNISSNSCIIFNGDDRANKEGAIGSVYCDLPNQYNTGVIGDVIVYEYDLNTDSTTNLATYVTVNNGKLYNMIPGKIYYWESVSDSTQNGKFYAFGERRIIAIDNLKDGNSDTFYQTRNIRDLGGIDVSYENAQGNQVNGTIKYGKLFRGEKIWGGSANSLQYFTKLGINHEMDLRSDSESVSNEEDSFISADKIIGSESSNAYEVIPYKIDYDTDGLNYNLVRVALIEIMNNFINDPNYSLYFHSSIGADRTGMIAYLLEGLLGASEEDRYRDYEMTVFFGLDERTRFYYNNGDDSTKFVYMKQAIRNANLDGSEDVVEWFLKGSSNREADMALIQQFRTSIVEVN